MYVAVVFGLVVVIGARIFVFASTPPSAAAVRAEAESRERDREVRTIEYCEEQYKKMNADRQYSPDMLRLHSMACRKLRDDFEQKWAQEP